MGGLVSVSPYFINNTSIQENEKFDAKVVQEFVGEYARQVRVVGQAAEPQALSYRNGMTLLDVMIEVGGLSEFASGNKAKIVRRQNGEEITIKVRVNDLLNKGDMEENVKMMPGDVLIIPESIF